MWRRDDEVFAEVACPTSSAPRPAAFRLHPALLDAALHPLLPGVVTRVPPRRTAVRLVGRAVAVTGALALRVSYTWTGPQTVSLSIADSARLPVR